MKAFIFVIAAGLLVGLAWPSQRAAAPVASDVVSDQPRETVLERSGSGHFYANVEVNGELVHVLVDTGATGIALTERDAERIGIAFDPGAYEQVGTGASGPVRGTFVTLHKVSLDGKAIHDVEGAILEGSEISLLGQDYLGRFSVEMRGDTMRIY